MVIETKKKFYTCKWDKPFKEILLNEKNRDILKKILEVILKVDIQKIQELNVERRVENIHLKAKRVDILLYTEKGLIGIELNARYQDFLHARNLAYHCDNYAHYTLRGEEYSEALQVIQINFTYGLERNTFTKKKKLKIVEVYEMKNERGESYVENFPLYEINMDKIMEFWYSKEEEKIKEYKYLIMLDLNLQELGSISKGDRLVEKYMENLERLNVSPDFHVYMTEEEGRRKCFNSEMRIARETGLSQGLSQGKVQGAKQNSREVAKSLLCLGVNTIEQIAEVTKLSLEEIEELQTQE